jgi:hypothetical protein
MGLYEVAEFLGITRSAVKSRLNAEGGVPFPEPIAKLRCGPIWEAEAITHYAKQRFADGPTGPYRWSRERWRRHVEREQARRNNRPSG